MSKPKLGGFQVRGGPFKEDAPPSYAELESYIDELETELDWYSSWTRDLLNASAAEIGSLIKTLRQEYQTRLHRNKTGGTQRGKQQQDIVDVFYLPHLSTWRDLRAKGKGRDAAKIIQNKMMRVEDTHPITDDIPTAQAIRKNLKRLDKKF